MIELQMLPGGTVYIIDDDEAVRDALLKLFSSIDLVGKSYSSGEAFLADFEMEQGDRRIGCAVVDLRMPGLSAFDVQAALAAGGIPLPVIFITGHGDVETGVRAIKAGAFDFIEKPPREQALLELVQKAIAKSARDWSARIKIRDAQQKLARLTPREREILDEIVRGEPNKRIAHNLGLSAKTVEFHRANLMHKMQARSLADLIQKTLRAGTS